MKLKSHAKGRMLSSQVVLACGTAVFTFVLGITSTFVWNRFNLSRQTQSPAVSQRIRDSQFATGRSDHRQLRPTPFLSIDQYPNAPARILVDSASAQSSDSTNLRVDFALKNIGTKTVRAYGVRYRAFAGNQAGEQFSHTVIIPQGKSLDPDQLDMFTLNSNAGSTLSLGLDYVSFADGTVWLAPTAP